MRSDPIRTRGGWPRWSEAPLPTLAALLTVGVVLGQGCLRPELAWSGAVAMALLGALSAGRGLAALPVALSALLLGVALGRPLPGAPAVSEHAVIQGRVDQVAGRSAVVRSPRGSWRLLFPSAELPSVGTRLSARTRPVRAAPRLPGAPDREAADQRAGRRVRRVVGWLPLDAEDAVSLPTLEGARYGGILVALATGSKVAVDPSLRALLQRTGTAHLLAISGLHVGLLAGMVHGVVGRLGDALLAVARPSSLVRWLRVGQAVAAIAAAALYAEEVGWPVSTQRAVVMVCGAALARASGRPLSPWSLLAAAAIAVILVDPSVVHSLGFGLSFGAVLGILGVAPRVLRCLPPDSPWWGVRLVEAVAVTVGAMAGTLPLSAFWFQELAPLSPLANLVAGPLIGAVAVPAALCAVHGPTLLQPVAVGVGDAAVAAALAGLAWMDTPPWAPAVGPVGALFLAAAVALRRQVTLLGALALGLGVLGARGCSSPEELQVTFLGVGQGDSVFVRFPDGRRWLVDGGPPSERVLQWLRREGHTRLDAVLLTHPDSDHLGGLMPVLQALEVTRFVTARPPRQDESSYRDAWKGLFARGIPVELALDGPVEGIPLLHPTPAWRETAPRTRRPRDNDDSLVLHLQHAGHSLMLTGDIEASAERWLAPRLPRVDVIQAPHHGSRSSSTSGLVAATDPDWVVVSCGAGNRFGHPHAQTLAQWRGRRLVRTDRQGTIRVRLRSGGLVVEHWVHGWGWTRLWRRPWRPLLPAGAGGVWR